MSADHRFDPSEEHPFLTARHVDNLIDAIRALNITITRLHEAAKTQAETQLSALHRIADHTANLPALMDVLMGQKSNGDAHDVADRDEQ